MRSLLAPSSLSPSLPATGPFGVRCNTVAFGSVAPLLLDGSSPIDSVTDSLAVLTLLQLHHDSPDAGKGARRDDRGQRQECVLPLPRSDPPPPLPSRPPNGLSFAPAFLQRSRSGSPVAATTPRPTRTACPTSRSGAPARPRRRQRRACSLRATCRAISAGTRSR